MKLSTPSFAIFLISTILVATVLLTRHTQIDVPLLTQIVTGKEYYVVLLAWILMFIGVTFGI